MIFNSQTDRPASCSIRRTATILLLAALLGFAPDARAENECGAPVAGEEIVCSPSTYDPADGNIFYGPNEANEGNFSIRLTSGLSINYDSSKPGDDFYFDAEEPENRRLSAVWVTPRDSGSGYTGDISLVSYADITSSGRGISVGHYGESGALRMEIRGGAITTTGDRSFAIHNYHEGEGDIDVSVSGITVRTDGTAARGIISSHDGEGDLSIDVGDAAFFTMGELASGIHATHTGAGDWSIEVRDAAFSTMGELASGIYAAHTGAGDLSIDVRDAAFSTMGEQAPGISGNHGGAGDLCIDVRDAAFSTMGEQASVIYGDHSGAGDLSIDVRDAALSTMGERASAIYAVHRDAGDLSIDVRDAALSTMGKWASAIYAVHRGAGDLNIGLRNADINLSGSNVDGVLGFHLGEGNFNLDAQDLIIETTEYFATGFYLDHRASGNLGIDVRSGSISTKGSLATGVRGIHTGEGRVHFSVQELTIDTEGDDSDGVNASHRDAGNLIVVARGLDVKTAGDESEGVFAAHAGEGEGSLDARDVTIATTGAGADAIIGGHTGAGDFGIRVRGGSLSTTGAGSHGVYGVHRGAGALHIDLRDISIETRGAGADGVASEHGGSGSVLVAVEGGSIRAAGTDANGVRMGRLDQSGIVESAAPVGENGYRSQTAAVNGRVSGGPGEGAGVFLAGGGRVVIGPGARLGAESGVAVRAAGDAPNLRVDVIGGRPVPELLDGIIRNDGGDTVLAVNGASLYESANGGRVDSWAPNGARDVALAEGFTGLDFTSPEDFIYRYTPRAAVYEALPGFLLRLDAPGLSEKRTTSPGSPVWARISGGRGSHEPERSSVGAEYDFSRFVAEAGLDVSIEEGVTAWGSVSVRRIRGSADVTSPVGGGKIEAEGLGATLGFSLDWHDANYTRGRLSLATYSADLSSNALGRLDSGVGAHANSLYFEVGRHVAVKEKMRLTPRVWMARSAVAAEEFTDAVNSRVAAGDANRFEGGLGVVAETERAPDRRGGALSLRGSLDLAQTLGGGETSTDVSSETLESESPKTRLLLGLGGTYRKDLFSMVAEISAAGLVSDDSEYSGWVTLGWKF